MGFHAEGVGRHTTPAQNRSAKERRVCEGRAHAALVYDRADCVGWCQFGSPDELPRIKRKRAYAELAGAPADWRITCFFTDKACRGRGVASSALAGALALIGGLGGGTVESFPEAVENRTTAGAFLHNGTLAMFEAHGFERIGPIGKHHWLVAKRQPAAR
jgi:ribosomal protein S18 acetylase RimI-like enzyme